MGATQTPGDIAYLEGLRQGYATVWNLTLKLYAAYAIILALLAYHVWKGTAQWARS